MKGVRGSDEILMELLPSLSNPMTADQAADKWPEEEPRGIQSIRNAFNKLARRGVVTRSGPYNSPSYTYTPAEETEPERPPMEVKWRAFRNNPEGYLESL